MTIHSTTTHTIFGHAYRMIDERGDLIAEKYGTEFEHHVIDGRVYVQVDSLMLDLESLRSLSIDVTDLQGRVDVENGVSDGESG